MPVNFTITNLTYKLYSIFHFSGPLNAVGFIPLIQKQSLTMTHAAPLNMLTVVVKVSLQLQKVAQVIIMQVPNPVVMLKLLQLNHL